MSGDDTFCSSSGSSDKPFHSTPVKTKVQFVSSKTVVESDSSSDSEVSKHSSESHGGHTTAGTLTKSLSRTALNTADSTLDEAEIQSHTSISTSAWEQWFLKKEKERRKELHIQIELKQKQRENDKQMVEVKLRHRKASEEHYHKWLNTKNGELKKRVEEEKRLKAKKELDAKVAREKAKQRTEMQLKKWKEHKLVEKKGKLENYGQESALSPEVEEHRHKCDSAFKQWLKKHHNWHREHYSYAYSGGIVVTYYDLTSSPPPSFFNPEPWVS